MNGDLIVPPDYLALRDWDPTPSNGARQFSFVANATITFPAPTTDWGTIVGFTIFGLETEAKFARRRRYYRQYHNRGLKR